MSTESVTPPKRTRRLQQGEKLRSADKVERIPVKVIPTETIQRKPEWMRIRLSASPKVQQIKNILREHKMATVCEEAACPNLHECFSNGTATFMIMGEIYVPDAVLSAMWAMVNPTRWTPMNPPTWPALFRKWGLAMW